MRHNPTAPGASPTLPPARSGRASGKLVLLLIVLSLFATTACQPAQLTVRASAPSPLVKPGTSASMTATATGGTQPYSYAWVQTAGVPVDLSDAAARTPQFLVPDVVGSFSFDVTVTDVGATSSTASITLWTDSLPALVISATGPTAPVPAGATVSLAASISGGQPPYRHGWTQSGGPAVTLTDPASAEPSFTMPTDGLDVVFTARGWDARGVATTTTVRVAAEPVQPLVATVEGPDQPVVVGQTVDLVSSVAGGVAPYTYRWTQTAGVSVVPADATAANLSFVVPADDGLLAFTLTVTDARGVQTTAPIEVTGPSSSCGASYRTVWERARAGSLFPAELGPLGRATTGSASTDGAGSTCDAATGFAISGASIELLDGAVTGADLAGRITGTGLCLDAGTLTFDSQLGPVSVVLNPANGLCLPIGEILDVVDHVDAIGFPNVNGFTVDLGQTTITVDASGAHLVADGTPATGGTAHAELDIALDGAVSGTMALRQVPLLGTPVDVTGSVSAPANGPLTGALNAMVPGPVEIVPGVALAGITATLTADGLAVSGEAQLAAPLDATVAFAGTHRAADSWSIDLDAGGHGPIDVSDHVRVGDDLALQIVRQGDGISGTGHASVRFTVDDAPQSVVADLALRADGTLIIGATVDLAPWGVGEGAGHVWFASDAAPDFDTQDPALGTIDLPAGLTAGVAVTIPQSAHDALTNVVGLDLPSTTVTLIASIDTTGSFAAALTVPTRPDSQLSTGVPGGLHLNEATLRITSAGFVVDVRGTAGSGTGGQPAGTVDVHLDVRSDGAIDGTIDLHQIKVLGQPMDLAGTLVAPAAGNLAVTVAADVAGPLEVADGFTLSNLHVRLDPSGVFVQGDARIAGATGPLVQVEGLITDDQTWAVQVTSAAAPWTAIDGLTLDASFAGTLRATDGVVTFDLTGGSPTDALAVWDLGDGNRATLFLARVADVPAPPTCQVQVDPGDVWVSADGSLALGSAGGMPVDLPVKACVNVTTGAFAIAVRSAQPIPLGRQVMLQEDLTLDLAGGAGDDVTGTGHATVVFTVSGHAQRVDADIELRPGGTLVIGATVDLAPWNLGDGRGHVWFATAAVPGFDTNNPALGTIDLPAGLTAGVAVTIPPDAYETLTDVLGLDLAGPSIVVVGSVTTAGDVTAKATVRTKPGHQLVAGVPGGLRLDTATVTITAAAVIVDLHGAAGATGTATAHLAVTDTGDVSGRLELRQLPVFGHPVDLVGDVHAPAGGALAGSLVADVAGPLPVAAGLTLRDIHLRLTDAGLVAAADAQVGHAASTLLHVEGTIADEQNWSLSIDSADRTGWTIIPGLTVNATLAGTISSSAGVVTFDTTIGGGSTPVASWDLGRGNGLALTDVRVANTPFTGICPTTVPAGDVWAEVDGRITLAGTTPIELPVHACINATTGAFSIDASTVDPLVISDQVRLADDLALRISGDGNGTITGTGHATIELTVEGTTQTVDANLALRGDGTFIVGASVDLAQWDLGEGLGHAWFATAEAGGFQTGDPALGTVDLPAGLTVAVSYTIPASTYRSLTETLGLELASPNLTVVASITTDGSFKAVATVATQPGRELLPGVPGGLRLGSAQVTFTNDGVAVDLVGTAGIDGTAEAHLTVTADGAVSGRVELVRVPVFGHLLDLVGRVDAPADGPLTGALTAGLPGPVVMSEQLTLYGLTVTLDENGSSIEGSAQLGGVDGPSVHVRGDVTDVDNWSFTVSTDASTSWAVLPDLTVDANLTGTVSSVAGLVTFDVVAGAGAAGSTDPLATWDLGHGRSVELTSARISNTVAPGSCGADVGIGNVWVKADGRLSVPANGEVLDIPIHVCIDITTGAFVITANTSAAIDLTDRIQLAPGVALAIRRDANGDVVGAGEGTVTFTVDGAPQSVHATIDLFSDGSLLIGASIDLAEWGLGQGTGRVWFSSADVTAFDTGDPALGSITLPAGLTVGISFEIPDALHRTLTADLGLVVPERTIAVVASITTDGSFRATASLAGRMDGSADVLTGIPGGVHLHHADLVFTDQGVSVDATAYTGTFGLATLQLDITNDGGITGHVAIDDVPVFGSSVHLEGDVSAPADGPLTGSLTADLDGSLWVSEHVELADIHIAYDPAGLRVSGTARLGVDDDGRPAGDYRVTVHVEGTYVDPSNWSLAVTSEDGTGYQVTPSLTIHATFTGEVTAVDGLITFDVTAGNAAQPLVDWDLNGNHVKLQTARISNRLMTPTCGLADEWYYGEGDLWVEADGLLTIALPGAPTVDAPVHACVDVATSAFLVHAETVDPIPVSDQVTIDPGMSLTLHGEQVQEYDGGPWRQAVWGEGTAEATFTVNGTPQSLAVRVEVDRHGTLIVGGIIDLAEWDLGEGVGHVWYTSAPVPDHDAGPDWGTVPLAGGVTVAVTIPIPAAASSALRHDIGLPVPDGKLTAVGQVGADGSFEATMRLQAIDLGNLFRTPGGATLTEAILQVTDDGIVLDGHGTIGDDLASGPGSFTMHLDVAADGTFAGSVDLRDLRVLGHELDFLATVTRQDGSFHFRAEADLPGAIPVADGAFSVSNVHVAMDSDAGLELAGDVRIPVPGDEIVARLHGYVHDDENWGVAGRIDLPAWTPFPELTIDASVEASVAVHQGRPEWELTVDDVVQWKPMDTLIVNFDQITISNAGSAYWACNDVVEPGHVWLYGRASAHLKLKGPDHYAVGAEGCIDLDDQDLAFDLDKTDPYPWDLGAVDVFDFNVDLAYEGDTGLFTFDGGALGWINLNGDIVVATIRVSFDSDGNVLLAASADFSQIVGAKADAHIYYSNILRPAFDTGEPEAGVIDLPAGVSVFVRIGLPEHINDTLKAKLGVDLTGTELWASATIDENGGFRLQVKVLLPGEGALVFKTSDDPATATWLRLQELHVSLDVAGTRRIEIGAGGLLHFPAMPGSAASDLPVEANLTVNLDTGDVAVGISTEGAVWHDAFGIEGLDLSRFGVSGGVSGGLPQLGLVATVVNLPQDWADGIGYQQGQVMSLAFNISAMSPLIEIQLGSPGNTTPVLLPGSASGNPNAFRVYYARMYLAPFATSIGGIDFPAGISFDLDGRVQGRPLRITASFDPSSKRLYGEAIVPEIRFGNALVIRNLYVKLDLAPNTMVLVLRGSATFGQINVIVDIAVGNGDARIDIRTIDAIPGISSDLDTSGSIDAGGGLSGGGDTQVQVGNILKDATVEMTDDGLLVHVPDFNGWEATATLSMSGLDLVLHDGVESDPFFLGIFEVGGGATIDLHVVITGDGWYASGLARVYVFASSVTDGWKRHYVEIVGVGVKVGNKEICVRHPIVPWPICIPTGANPLDQGVFVAPETTLAEASADAPTVPSIAPDRVDGQAFAVVPESAVERTADGRLTLDGTPVDESVVVVVPDAQFETLAGAR